MKAVQIAKDIVPIADAKAHLGQLVRGVRDQARTVVITQHGRPAAVLVSPDTFDELHEQTRFLAAVLDGLEDAAAGRVLDDDEVRAEMDREFGPMK